MSTIYKKAGLICAAAAAGAVLCTMPVSIERSETSGIALSVDQARAVVDQPATPGSVAFDIRRDATIRQQPGANALETALLNLHTVRVLVFK